MFKFVKKGNRFRWEGNSTAIEYSKPNIQSHNSFTIINSEDEILYFYYSIKIFKKEDDDKWHLKNQGYALDFPCIQQIKSMIETIIDMQPNDEWQTVRFIDGSISKKYILDTEGFGQDDYCSIQKDVYETRECYTISFGFPFENGIGDIYGVTIKHLSEKDILEFYECLKAFIEYAIKRENKIISRELFIAERDKEVKDGKLYIYNTDNKKINRTKIDEIYVAGDILSTCYIRKDGEAISLGHLGYFIEQIEKDSIIIRKDDDITNVKIKNILWISTDIAQNILNWDEVKIKEHFKEFLSEREKHYFINNPLEEVEKMYENALINRYWMCRTEHPYHDDEIKNVEKAHLVAKIIISKIRDELL